MLTDLERLVAIEDIRLLKALRDRAVDDKDWDAYEAMHSADFLSSSPGRPDWIGAREARERAEQISRPLTTIHHSLSPAITIHSPTQASAVWLMTDYLFWEENEQQHSLQGFGHYDETYEKIDGQWHFKTRTLRYRHKVAGPEPATRTLPPPGPAAQSG